MTGRVDSLHAVNQPDRAGSFLQRQETPRRLQRALLPACFHEGRLMLRDATPADFPSILALNEAFVTVLSPLDGERLAQLHAQAAAHRVIEQDGQIAAFLLAFREGADYDGANYRWFAQRYARFLYVDRIVVAAGAQAQGSGSALYRDAGALASRDGVPLIACEFDIEPPNPASARFHAQQGFREIGQRQLLGGKIVSMQVLDVSAATGRNRDG